MNRTLVEISRMLLAAVRTSIDWWREDVLELEPGCVSLRTFECINIRAEALPYE